MAHLMGMGTGVSSAHLVDPGSLLPLPILKIPPYHLPVVQAWKLSPMIPPWDPQIVASQTGLVSWFFYSLHDLV